MSHDDSTDDVSTRQLPLPSLASVSITGYFGTFELAHAKIVPPLPTTKTAASD